MGTRLCETEGCENPTENPSGQRCRSCRHRLQRYGDTASRAKPVRTTCSMDGCFGKHLSLGFCRRHYRSYKRWGDAAAVDQRRDNTLCVDCGADVVEAKPKWGRRCEGCYLRGMRLSKVRAAYGESAVPLFDKAYAGAGVCAVCGTDKCKSGRRLSIDHNHETGEVRGLLCGDCNRALGLLGEDFDRIMSLASYMLSYQNVLGKVV